MKSPMKDTQSYESQSNSDGLESGDSEAQNIHSESLDSWMQSRKLFKSAGIVTVWAMAVALVSAGDFFGFNAGFAIGGFAGYLIPVGITTVMFICLTYTIAELAGMMPYAGGSYVWNRVAMGKFMGSVSGSLDSIEYICVASCITWLIGVAMVTILELHENYVLAFACAGHVIVAAVNSLGGRFVWWTTILFACYIITAVVCFFFGTIFMWRWEDNLHYFFTDPKDALILIDGGVFYQGVKGVFYSFAPGMWCFLGIEATPLIAEECKKARVVVPKGMIIGIFTIVPLAWMSLLASAFLPGGVTAASAAFLPLNLGYYYIFQEQISEKALTALHLPILFSAPFVFTFAYGRQIYALGRAGYLPSIFSYVLPRTRTPVISIAFGVVLSTVIQAIVWFAVHLSPATIIYYACAIPALVNYILISIGFILLRYYKPIPKDKKLWLKGWDKVRGYRGDTGMTTNPKDIDMDRRPFKSWIGIPGAMIIIGTALLSLGCSFYSIREYTYSLVIVVPYVIAGIIYYLVYGRHHLNIPPEEKEAAGLVLFEVVMQKGISTNYNPNSFWGKVRTLLA